MNVRNRASAFREIASIAQDTSTGTPPGDMPSSGGARPGPGTAITPSPPPVVGAIPVTITIQNAQVDAVVEQREIIDGVMQDPSGPWVVSWYKETPKVGSQGNTLMAGHVDYRGVGPSVFANVSILTKGDLITISGDNGKVYTYKVSWVRLYNADNAPLQEIVGATPRRALTLITCGGVFDQAAGVYLERTVVRANYVGSSTPA